ncbi:MAG: metal ABC transporter ATP-binding protein [Solirubrobacterales bacterium]
MKKQPGVAGNVTIEDVRVNYGDTVALDGINVTFSPGQVHGLIGMNGSGKSTLYKAMMGLVPTKTGTISLFGVSSKEARRSQRVAYAPQSEIVDWNFPVSVSDVVMMGRYGHMGWRRHAGSDDRKAVAEALSRVELEDLADRQIGALSGGQRKRAFVARGLAQGAELMLLDEPFAGVDKRSEATMTKLLRSLAADGRTIIVSTHDLIAVPALCDTVSLINRRIIASGDPSEILIPELLTEAFGGFVPQEALQMGNKA